MGNSHFNFKKFKIKQDKAAMKVGIDGVLLGAICNVHGCKRALDIGTGTGLLALMIAQRNTDLHIDAIDIDANAILNAKENTQNSVFSEQIKVNEISLQHFAAIKPGLYDLIICNPPYFTEDIKPDDESRKNARHNDSLPIDELFRWSKQMLSPKGEMWTIYPYQSLKSFQDACEQYGWFIQEITSIHHTVNKRPKRFVAKLGAVELALKSHVLSLKDTTNYTNEFKNLTKDFYLNF